MKSRQAQMYDRRIAAGLCAQCGTEPLVTKTHCQGCREEHNKRMREGFRARNGTGSWVEGKRGRPPLEAKRGK